MALGTGLLAGRLIYLQLYKGGEYSQKAVNQRMRPQSIDAHRGSILDRNYKTLAASIGADAVYVIPERVDDVATTARELAPFLTLSETAIKSILENKAGTSWLERGLTPETAAAIRALGLPGIRLTKRPQRYYPNGSLAAHVLGIAGIDNQGLEGTEYYYDEILRGIPGQMTLELDAAQRNIPGGAGEFLPPIHGSDVILTLDSVLQFIAETKIQEAVQSSKSERGLVLIMAPRSGEILANAIFPAFDPNQYQESSLDRRRNVAITDQYEPGSTFKFITAAASMDLGLTSYDRSFNTGSSWEIGGGLVHNSDGRAGGKMTFLEAFERSDNIVFAQLSHEMGAERFYPYIRNFGFGQRLGVDFPGEISGMVASPNDKGGQTLQWANIGFGQGIAVTPLQLVTAMSAVANDGVVMKPFFVKEIRDSYGKLVEEYEPEVLGTAVSAATAARIRELLRSVVVNGSGVLADVPGYFLAGKTGTAEVPERGGYGEQRIASFVGFGPIDEPALTVLVILYNPQAESPYGGVLAAPAFKEIMEESLLYLGVKRRRVEEQKAPLVMVPDVSNFSQSEALARLEKENLRWTVEGEGTLVSGQNPGPGTRVAAQSVVHLSFQTNDEQSEVTVPSVLGLSLRDASLKLSEAGLKIRITGSGLAQSQTPAPGGKAPFGATVEVVFGLADQ